MKFKQVNSFFFPSFLLLFAMSAAAQIPTPSPAAAPPLDQILNRADAQRLLYIERFKDLLSQETKSFEVYDKNGEPKKKRTVVSTFIVYQSAQAGEGITEFRNVISVDGRTVEDADKRAQDFFEQIAKAASDKELDSIEKEGSRFDQDISINGLTLFQAVALAENIRPDLEFRLEGEETFDGARTFVVSYRQVRENRYISIDPERYPSGGKPALIYDLGLEGKRNIARISGKFWIDAATFQVRKESRTLSVQQERSASAFNAVETVLSYQDSPFGILTPKKLAFTQFQPGKNDRPARKEISVSFEYQNFTKPDVEVKSADIK